MCTREYEATVQCEIRCLLAAYARNKSLAKRTSRQVDPARSIKSVQATQRKQRCERDGMEKEARYASCMWTTLASPLPAKTCVRNATRRSPMAEKLGGGPPAPRSPRTLDNLSYQVKPPNQVKPAHLDGCLPSATGKRAEGCTCVRILDLDPSNPRARGQAIRLSGQA